MLKVLVDILYKIMYDNFTGDQSKHRQYTTKYEDLCM